MESIPVSVGLWVRLEAKVGKEQALLEFLKESLALVVQEPATVAWFAIRLGPSTFGIFDAFPNERARQSHLEGRIATALMTRAEQLLTRPPVIEKVDVLAAKLPK
jgi:quinol monooxygenase YgiN